MENENTFKIRSYIIEHYGSINNFVDKNYTKLSLSRTHVYKLINYEIQNPGIQTLKNLAEILDLPLEEVSNDYLAGYRNRRSESQYSD